MPITMCVCPDCDCGSFRAFKVCFIKSIAFDTSSAGYLGIEAAVALPEAQLGFILL